MTASESAEFWLLVRACLSEIYGIPRAPESERIYKLVDRLQKRSGNRSMIYHNDPMHVANDIADSDHPATKEMWDHYDRIVQRIRSSAERKKPVELQLPSEARLKSKLAGATLATR